MFEPIEFEILKLALDALERQTRKNHESMPRSKVQIQRYNQTIEIIRNIQIKITEYLNENRSERLLRDSTREIQGKQIDAGKTKRNSTKRDSKALAK